MTGNEFIRRVSRLARQRGVRVALVPERGKGSHGTWYYGERLIIVRNPRDELKTGTLHAMLPQLGLSRDDLQELARQHFVYPARLTPEEQDGGFVVTFPDLSEAMTQGDNTLDALRQGADCLEEAIAGRIRRHEGIPEPSPVGQSFYAIPLSAQMVAKAALYLALCQAGITQVELASRLHCDEKEVRRLLDPCHASKLSRLESALAALGQQLVVGMQATV